MADEKIEQKTEITDKIQTKDKPWLYKKGQSGNLNGKPKGTKSFDTLFEEAIKIIVKEKKIPGLARPEIDLVIKAVNEGLKGNYPYFRDIMDRRFGRPKETIDFQGNLSISSVLDSLDDRPAPIKQRVADKP